MRKKTTIFVLFALCAALCLSACSTASGPKATVVQVSELLGIGPVGMVDRNAGVVEAGDTVKVDRDSQLEVAEIAVEVGDAVLKGQVLFTYETAALSIEVERMQLELEQMNNSITTKKSQITTLEKEQKTATEANKLQYTLQIQQLQLDIKETEYQIAAKQKDIDRAKANLADSNVLSPCDGHIKAINSGSNSVDPNMGEPLPFLTITQEGDFRVRGTVNEMTAASFSEGTPVLIRSRIDETQVWTGTVTKVDWENPSNGNANGYYGPTDEMTSTSKYPFYVKLDSDAGLMLGQHVYIEQDIGQGSDPGDGTYFYLPSYFISDLETDPWVWSVSDKDKLEKRHVMLGNYNMDLDSYEIMDGLSLTDYIAYPDESYKVGMAVRFPGDPENPTDEAAPYDGEEVPDDSFGGMDGLTDDGFFGDGLGDAFVPETDGVVEPVEPIEARDVPDPGVAAVQGTEAVG